MEYLHINNQDVYRRGRVDANWLFLNSKKYTILSFELATGNFIVEEIKDKN